MRVLKLQLMLLKLRKKTESEVDEIAQEQVPEDNAESSEDPETTKE